MPYIAKKKRSGVRLNGATNAGELNFEITTIINYYVLQKGLKYQTMNDVVGALEGAKAEFQRRVVFPYEDTKIATNGDVYDQDLLSRPDVGHPKV